MRSAEMACACAPHAARAGFRTVTRPRIRRRRPARHPGRRSPPRRRLPRALFAAAALLAPAATAHGRPPNILLILADDLGYGDVGCFNPEAKVATPNLDRLAAEGMKFTDAHSPSTVCTPTRYSILTGRMAFRHGLRGVFTGAGGPNMIEEGRPTIAGVLKGAGYRTALIGKWHVGLTFLDQRGEPIAQNGLEAVRRIDFSRPIPDAPVHRGFDAFFGTACCPTTDWLYAFIDGDRVPVPPAGQVDKAGLPTHPYSRDCRPGLIAPDFDLQEVDEVFLRKSLDFLDAHAAGRRDQPFFLFHSTQAVHLPSFAGERFRGATEAGPHGDFIAQLDATVGELMAALERHGFADETLVFFTSDNGPEIASVVNMREDYQHDGANPWRGIKRDQWEGGHRVPTLARWPGAVAPGSECAQPLCLTDLFATFAAAAGAGAPAGGGEDSFDFLPVLLGEAKGHAVRPFVLHQTWTNQLAIRAGDWKYLDHRGSGGNRYDRPPLERFAIDDGSGDAGAQLYNLRADPGETRNLIREHPAVAAALKAQLDATVESGRSR